ncbi:MAG TPA: hypothetical protein VHA30_01935, partial [Patescibacteria group bacterium]|nr:hypothetical protein [Patescibacteria group bacterium]
NFNSEFAKSQDSTVTLTASSVLVELDGPATTNNAQLIVYTVKYQNNSDADIQNARVKMNYPDGFKFASATPPPDLGADTWDVGTLAKGGSGTIQIQGTFASANPGETKTATADFLVLDATGQANVQNSSVPLNTSISSLPLLVSQSLQGNNSSGVVNPGDTLTVNVTYQNNAATAASGVNIQATVNSKAVDLSSLRAEGGQINNNTIIWNAAGVPQLQSLSPNQSGSLSFSFKLKNPAVTDASKNLAVVSDIQMQSNEYSSPFPGNELNLKVSSPAAVNTGLTFVSGQLPPQVGRATVYDIKFSLVNSSNDFSNGVLTAYLPLAGGGFNSSSVTAAEAGNVQFDAASGKLTWNFGSLPAYSGKFNQARVLEFQVTLNPSASQAGQSPTLVKNIGLSATDLFTGQNVSLSARDLTTSSLQGQSGYGVGQVQP